MRMQAPALAETSRTPAADRPASLGPRVAPRNATEIYLASLWARALRVTPVGIEDDFFGLGDDSIAATALFAALERDLGVRLPASRLMGAATIARLAAMPTRAGAMSSGPLVPLRAAGARLPLFCVHPFGV